MVVVVVVWVKDYMRQLGQPPLGKSRAEFQFSIPSVSHRTVPLVPNPTLSFASSRGEKNLLCSGVPLPAENCKLAGSFRTVFFSLKIAVSGFILVTKNASGTPSHSSGHVSVTDCSYAGWRVGLALNPLLIIFRLETPL